MHIYGKSLGCSAYMWLLVNTAVYVYSCKKEALNIFGLLLREKKEKINTQRSVNMYKKYSSKSIQYTNVVVWLMPLH